MESGVFTNIIYQSETVIGKEVPQEGMIIGPPIRTEDKRKLCIIGDPGLNLLVNVASGGVGYDVSQILKPIVDDQVVNVVDVQFFIEDANGDNEKAMDTISDNFKLPLVISSASDYNLSTASKFLATIGIDKMLGKKFTHTTDDDLTAVDEGSDLYTIADSTAADDCIAEKIESIERGDILIVDGTESAIAIAAVTGVIDAWILELTTLQAAKFNTAGGWAEYDDGVDAHLFYYGGISGDTLTGCVFFHNEDKTPLDTGTVNQIATAYVTAIDKATKELTVFCGEDLDGAYFVTTGELNTWELYHDYSGIVKGTPTVYPKRSPKVKMSITANRQSVSGKYTISSMGDLVDLFGANSVINSDSHLAFDAAWYFTVSQTKFYIFAMDVDATTPAYGEANALSTVEVAKAINATSKYKVYHLVPSYRFNDVTDKAAVLAILGLYKAAVITRTSINSRNEGHLWCTIPLINKGFGYVDASGAAYGGTDLSEVDAGTLFNETLCDSYDDVDAIMGLAGDNFNSELVTLLPAHAFVGNDLLAGSAVAAVVAGFRASLDPGYSTTNETIPGITSVPSVEYFTKDQIESLKNAGWQIIYQENTGVIPIIYHQTTTEPDTLQKLEEDLVIATHLCASEIRATLSPFIARGKVNRLSSDPTSPVTAGTLNKLNSAISGIKRKYVIDERIFSSLAILGIAQNTTNPDQSDIKLKIEYYYPHNRANVTIFV